MNNPISVNKDRFITRENRIVFTSLIKAAMKIVS